MSEQGPIPWEIGGLGRWACRLSNACYPISSQRFELLGDLLRLGVPVMSGCLSQRYRDGVGSDAYDMTRTFAIGDIHGDTQALFLLMSRLPTLTDDDTLVFLGDYLDRGENSARVVEWLMALPNQTRAKVVCLRGNHEDAWLRVIDDGWDAFVAPRPNGCLETLRSFTNLPCRPEDEPSHEEEASLYRGDFFPKEVVDWMRSLLHWYEDENAIYVHAGLMEKEGIFLHPSDTEPKVALLWLRDERFFRDYRGKRVVFGHTRTEFLPEELSGYTPEDPTDLWAGPCCIGVDTGAGCGGFLSACELPGGHVYESR